MPQLNDSGPSSLHVMFCAAQDCCSYSRPLVLLQQPMRLQAAGAASVTEIHPSQEGASAGRAWQGGLPAGCGPVGHGVEKSQAEGRADPPHGSAAVAVATCSRGWLGRL